MLRILRRSIEGLLTRKERDRIPISKGGNEKAARDLIEKLRWPRSPACPHCGSTEICRLTSKTDFDNHGRKGEGHMPRYLSEFDHRWNL